MTQTAISSSARTVELWYQGALVGQAVRERAGATFVLEAANEEFDQALVYRDIHRLIHRLIHRRAPIAA